MKNNNLSFTTIQMSSITIIVLTFLFYPLLNALDDFHRLPDWLYYGLDYLWQYGSILLALLVLLKMEPKTIWHLTNPTKNSLLFVGHFVLLFLWAIVSMAFLPAPVTGQEVGRILEESTTNIALLSFLVNVLLIGPIREEVIFRGLVFANFQKWNKGKLSTVISATLFSFLHLPFNNLRVTDFMIYFINGLIFANLYKKTKSITWVILLHIAWNGFVYYMSTR